MYSKGFFFVYLGEFDPAITMNIEELKAHTKVTDCQLNRTIQEEDMFELAAYFDNVENYLVHLGLNRSQQTDVKALAISRGTQTAMSHALRLWRQPNPFNATYRTLVEILLLLDKQAVALEVCDYLAVQCCNYRSC